MNNQQLLSDIFSGLDLSDINRINSNSNTYKDTGLEDQPNYLKGTFASSTPSTSYEEVDRIRNSFRTGNKLYKC